MILAPGAVEGELYITAVVLIVFFALFAKLSVLEEKRMRRRTMRNLHNTILKAVCYLMALVLIISICAMDQEKVLLPAILCIVSGGFLTLVAYSNGLLK
jgi:phosphatidylserine synthase